MTEWGKKKIKEKPRSLYYVSCSQSIAITTTFYGENTFHVIQSSTRGGGWSVASNAKVRSRGGGGGRGTKNRRVYTYFMKYRYFYRFCAYIHNIIIHYIRRAAV